MNEETLVEDLVRAGLSAELVGRVARVLVLLGKARNSAELTEQRRAKDRERKKKKPSKSKELPKANDVGNVRGIPGKSAEAASERCDLTSLLSSLNSTSSSSGRKKELVEGRKRGARIPPNWWPAAETIEWCRVKYGVSGQRLENLVGEFVDYWIAIPGQRGCKLDWEATFRNRVRNVIGRINGHGQQSRHRGKSLADAADDLIARAKGLGSQIDLEPDDYSDTGSGGGQEVGG